ncbi:MAG: outer membrane protein assembly factor BamA [Enterobacterales bacterium]
MIKFVLKKFLLYIFLIFLFLINKNIYCFNKFKVKNIFFKGLNQINIDLALSKMPIKINDTITNKDIKHAIHKMFKTGFFENIEIKNDKNFLIVKLQEFPILEDIQLIGNKITTDKNIINFLNNYNICVGEFISFYKIENIKKKLKNFYYNFGAYNVNIDIKTVLSKYNRIKLIIKCIKNSNIKIKKIKIIGNKYFSKKVLKNEIKLKDSKSIFDFTHDYIYNKNQLDQYLKNLNDFYMNHGFICFHIDSVKTNFTYDKKFAYINIYINEGERYRIYNVIINGNIDKYYKEIKSISTKLSKGYLYSNNILLKIEKYIKKILNFHNYFYPKILFNFKINDTNKNILININIDIGSRLYVRNIDFEGNNFTNDNVLRREICQTELSLLNPKLINDSIKNLNNLGYFDHINVKINPVKNLKNQVDLMYKVKENKLGHINFNLGLGEKGNIGVNINSIQENILGNGTYLSILGHKDKYQSYAEITGYNPYYLTNGTSIRSILSFNNINKKNIYGYNLYNFSTNDILSFHLCKGNTFNLGINYQNNIINNINPQVILLRYLNSINYTNNNKNVINNNINLNINDIFFSYNWLLNNLDNKNLPTQGLYLNLKNKITIFGSVNEYYKLDLYFKKYIPLNKSKSLILLLKSKLGYAGSLLHNKDIPFYDLYNSGRQYAIRGFKDNSIGPKAVYYKCNNLNKLNINNCILSKSNDTIGGNAIALVSTELILPNPSYMNNINLIRTSLFIDACTILDTKWENSNEITNLGIENFNKLNNNIHIACGISFKWMSPLGPIIISFAKPIKKSNGDKVENFQFNISNEY